MLNKELEFMVTVGFKDSDRVGLTDSISVGFRVNVKFNLYGNGQDQCRNLV